MSKTPVVVRSVAATFATQIISWILSFAVMIYVPRYVGAVGYGKYALAASIVGIFSMIVPLGTGTVLVRDIARDRSRTGELLLSALIVRVPLALLMTVVAIATVRLLGYPEITRLLVTLMALGMVFGTVNESLASALQGQEKIPRQSLALLIEKFLSSATAIGLVYYRAPLWAFAAIGLFTVSVSLLVNLTAFAPLFPTLRWPSKTTVRYVVAAGMPFVAWTLFRTLYGQADPIILSLITNDQTVGWYAAALRLVGTTMFLPVAMIGALFPTLTRLYQEDLNEFQKLARRMLDLIILCAAPIACVCFFEPDRLIALMHYPKDFLGSVPVLRIGALSVYLYFMATVLGTIVIATDGQSKMLRASIAATIMTIPACLLGSYVTHVLWKNGAIGAMFSDALVEVYLVLSYLRMMPARTFNISSLFLMGRSLIAALPVALLLAATTRSHWGLWGLLPCIPVYLLMCWALRCLDPQYLVLARSILARRGKA